MLDELRKLSQDFLRLKNSPYRRYFIRSNQFKHRLSLLLGQRGIGKTTTLIQFLLDSVSQDLYSPSIFYVQADHFLMGTTSLYEIAEEFYAMGGKYIAFDEIHKYHNWSQELKSIYDTFPNLTIVASGSSALQVYQGSHDLARRAIKYNMVGLSFREFLEMKTSVELKALDLSTILEGHEQHTDEVIHILETKHLKILPLFQYYLKYGYYPYFFELADEELYVITLTQNLQSTLEVDLAAIYPHLNGLTIRKLKELLMFIATSVPFIPNWNTIKEVLDVGDVRTLKTYFSYLEDASLIRTLVTENRKLDHVKHSQKVYLDNPNQMNAFGLGDPDVGTERELFFLDMLSVRHLVTLPSQGDFLVDKKYLFEVGGRKKTSTQIRGVQDAFLACDNIERGIGIKIPLWLFGFLY